MLKNPQESGLTSPTAQAMSKCVLVADDDALTRLLLKQSLESGGFRVRLCESGEEALDVLKATPYPVLLSDIRMWGMDGLALVAELKKRGLLTVPILMTGFGSLEGAVEAIKQGAFDYISKPFRPADLVQLAERAWNHWCGLVAEHGKPAAEITEAFTDPTEVRFIGRSPAIVSVYTTVARAALTSSTVLITGESGTGKELIARAIHRNGNRSNKPFVAVNCSAISETLLESELFGYVRGAFTGAQGDKKGLFEEASGGTIFLDEIGDISPAMQVKLLRVLQYGEVKPVGSSETRVLDTRVVAATHRNLSQRVQQGQFREDLYYRLKVISIELPPLRQRPEDIRDLAQYFLVTFCKRNHRTEMSFSETALKLLESYDWPGNIRELEHAVEYAVAMAQGNLLFPENFPDGVVKRNRRTHPEISHAEALVSPNSSTTSAPLPPQVAPSAVDSVSPETLADSERNHILATLQSENHNRTRAARRLGIDRATLYRKMWKYNIVPQPGSGSQASSANP